MTWIYLLAVRKLAIVILCVTLVSIKNAKGEVFKKNVSWSLKNTPTQKGKGVTVAWIHMLIVLAVLQQYSPQLLDPDIVLVCLISQKKEVDVVLSLLFRQPNWIWTIVSSDDEDCYGLFQKLELGDVTDLHKEFDAREI